MTILERLKKKLLSLEPNSSSFWTNYSKKRDHYSDNDIAKKKQIIENSLKDNKGKVLDVGCNTGEFLFLASKYSSESHGIDIDEDCINHIQKKLGDNSEESEVTEEEAEEEEEESTDSSLFDRLWDEAKGEEFSDDILKELSESNPTDLAKMYLDYRNSKFLKFNSSWPRLC